MDNIILEKAIYEAIRKIRRLDKRRPCTENIVKVASAKNGLSEDAVQKHLEFLVESGAVYVQLTAKGEESYFILIQESLMTVTQNVVILKMVSLWKN